MDGAFVPEEEGAIVSIRSSSRFQGLRIGGTDIAEEEGILEIIPPSREVELQKGQHSHDYGLYVSTDSTDRASNKNSMSVSYDIVTSDEKPSTVQNRQHALHASFDESLSFPASSRENKNYQSESFEFATSTIMTSTENWTNVPSDAFNSLKSRVTTWRTMRNDCAQKRFQDVARLGLLLIAIGVVLFALATSLRSFRSDVYCYIFGLSGLLLTLGWTTLTTSPPDKLDLDLLPDKHKKTFLTFAVGMALMGLIQSMAPPHLHILPCLVAASEASRCDKCARGGLWPLHTTTLGLWVILQKICNAAGNLHTFLGSCSDVAIIYEDCKPDMFLYLISGLADVLFGVLLSICIFYLRLYDTDLQPTLVMYAVTYFHLTTGGMQAILFAVWIFAESQATHSQILNAYALLSYGLLVSFPIFVLAIVGRNSFFNFVARKFEKGRSRQDGAFIAELLDNISVDKGVVWFVHHGRDDPRHKEFDPRRNWDRGHVVEVGEHEIVVSVPSREGTKSQTLHRVFLPNRGASATELLTMADRSLRCVDFTVLELHWEELFATKGTQSRGHCFSWSRNIGIGERIDFFMSHSWHDPGVPKWRKVQICAKNFYKRQTRYPTFWIDCVCIEQSRIADGLRVLPLYLMACDSILILCGSTYPKRLWCAWELFTLVTLVDQAVDRVHFMLPLELDPALELSSSFGGFDSPPDASAKQAEADLLRSFENFDIRKAHCYDPNEQSRILRVIASIGTNVFHTRIRALAKQLSQRHISLSRPSLLRLRSTSSLM